ncbi:TPA: hypothetical protein ACH3X1_015782 [Trebouxia sp. C0004]
MQKNMQVSAMLLLSQLLYASLQAKENKLDGLLSHLRDTSVQAPLASFEVLCNMRSVRGQTHAARDAARTQHLQDLSIHQDWVTESPVDWKQFLAAIQTGSECCSVVFNTGPLKGHCVSVRSLLTLPMPTILAMIMQYKELCHDQLEHSQLSQDQLSQDGSSHSQLDHALLAHHQPQQQLLSHGQHMLNPYHHPHSLDQQIDDVEQQNHLQSHYQQTHHDAWCQQQQQQQQQNEKQQQQQQPRPEAAPQMNEMLIKEYVAVGMLGSESDPLEPFHMQASTGNVMQADIVWLAKWSKVLDATQLTATQQQELAALSHWYSFRIHSLQQRAQALCEQLKESLLSLTARSHVSMQVFDVAAALQDCLEEQHECSLQVIRKVCLQVLTPKQMGRMCAACWPHMIDFPALVHVVATRFDHAASEQMSITPKHPATPEFLNLWLSKQPNAPHV